jgi:ABC-type transporter Mla subunit MlaD
MSIETVQKATHRNEVVAALVSVISGIVPLLDDIKATIEESSTSVRHASKQLPNVTQATESVTVEILNVLRSVTQRISKAQEGLATLKDLHLERQASTENITDIVRTLAGFGGASERASAVAASREEHRSLEDGWTLVPVIEQSLSKTKQVSMNIAKALQVPDITAQEISGVTPMIESVRMQLQQVLDNLNSATPSRGDVPGCRPADRSFDIDARFTGAKERQDRAGAAIEQWKKLHFE